MNTASPYDRRPSAPSSGIEARSMTPTHNKYYTGQDMLQRSTHINYQTRFYNNPSTPRATSDRYFESPAPQRTENYVQRHAYQNYQNYQSQPQNLTQSQHQPNSQQQTTPHTASSKQPQSGLNRKNSEVFTNLKAELLNIKSEVSKLISKDEPGRKKPMTAMTSSRAELTSAPMYEETPTYASPNRSLNYADIRNSSRNNAPFDRSDTLSVTSETVERPIRELGTRLKAQGNVDKARYFELENELLKNELKNLKNKYVAKKAEYEEREDMLNKKIFMLEGMVKEGEIALETYKSDIEVEINTIREQMKLQRQEREDIENQSRREKDRLNAELLFKTEQVNKHQEQLDKMHKNQLENTNTIKKLQEVIRDTENDMSKKMMAFDIEVQKLHEELKLRDIRYKQTEIENANYREAMRSVDEEIVRIQNDLNNNYVRREQEFNAILKDREGRIEDLKEALEKAHSELRNISRNTALAYEKSSKDSETGEGEEAKQPEISLNSGNEEVLRILRSREVELLKLKTDIKMVNREADRLESQLSLAKKECVQYKQKTQKLEAELSKHNSTVPDTLEQHKAIIAEQEQLIQNLSHNIDFVSRENAAILGQLQDRGIKLQHLDGEIVRLTELYVQTVRKLEKEQENKAKIEEKYQEDLRLLSLQKETLVNKMESAENTSNDTIKSLKEELTAARDNWHNRLTSELATFEDALKEQIAELNTLKTQLSKKTQEAYRLQDYVSNHRSTLQALKAELEIEKLKGISERKNIQVALEIEIQNLKNQNAGEKRSVESLASKLKLLAEENKRKDEFVQKYIMGKKGTQDEKEEVQKVFQQFKLEFGSGDLKKHLLGESEALRKLEDANKLLVLQIAQLVAEKNRILDQAA